MTQKHQKQIHRRMRSVKYRTVRVIILTEHFWEDVDLFVGDVDVLDDEVIADCVLIISYKF